MPDETGQLYPAFMKAVSSTALRWQCRRGMLELDVLLERYLSEQYEAAGVTEQARFQQLLTAQDSELQSWLLNGLEHPDSAYSGLIAKIRGV